MALDRRGFAKSLSGVVGAVLAGMPTRQAYEILLEVPGSE